MVDIANIDTILTSIKTATDIAKLIKNSGTSLEQAEIKLKLAELVSALADAKIEMATVQQALSEKDAQIQELRKKLDVRGNLDYRDPAYWLKAETGDDGPFCQRCYDTDEKLVRLQNGSNGLWICQACDKSYNDPERRMRHDAQIKQTRPSGSNWVRDW